MATAVAAAPFVVDPNTDMGAPQIRILQDACRAQHEKNGLFWGRILSVASMVAGLYTAVMFGGIGGAALGLAAFLLLSKLFCETYHGLRNQDYVEAGQALNARNFREFIISKQYDLSIDTIVAVHKKYREHLVEQMQQ